MRLNIADQIKTGGRISYDDDRPGHQGVQAEVLDVLKEHGMLVQFEDRADTTYICFSDPKWMDSISIKQ